MLTLVWAKHEISEASLSFEEVESWIVWMKDGALPSVVHSIGKNSFLVGIAQKCCPWFFFFLSLSFRMYLVGGARTVAPAGRTMRLLFTRIKCLLLLTSSSMALAHFPSTNFLHYCAAFLAVVARSKMYR